jgi:short-subunit dehydrogenase
MKTLVSVLFLAASVGALSLAKRRVPLAGKNVVITGGGRGLGLQIAREAAKRGGRIALCARSETELTAARDELHAAGHVVVTGVCDVRDDASVERAFADFAERLGPIDVVFNVAGVIGVGPLDALTFADFRDAMETNFFGALRATYAVLPAMRARKSGSIVNVTSIGGEIAVPHLLAYCASKFAFVGYSAGLQAEVARDGIRVTTVVPGLMRTGSPPHASFAGQTKKEYALFALTDATPLTSVSVEHAARVIVDGCERGAKRVVVSWQAKLALLAKALAPAFVARMLELTASLLPRGGATPEHASGFASESAITQSPLNALSKHASQTQNETIDPV